MTPSAKQLLALAALTLSLAACVDRRIIITSDPPGAAVFLNDVDVGRTPAEVSYTYTGVYDVRLRAPGHEPLVTKADTGVPITDVPPLDLLSQAIPPTDRSTVRWHFTLHPTQVDRDALVGRALELRSRNADAFDTPTDHTGNTPPETNPPDDNAPREDEAPDAPANAGDTPNPV